eukprot:5493286-Amphidinium_carterae.1
MPLTAKSFKAKKKLGKGPNWGQLLFCFCLAGTLIKNPACKSLQLEFRAVPKDTIVEKCMNDCQTTATV